MAVMPWGTIKEPTVLAAKLLEPEGTVLTVTIVSEVTT
jgi:hypothetical protein